LANLQLYAPCEDGVEKDVKTDDEDEGVERYAEGGDGGVGDVAPGYAHALCLRGIESLCAEGETAGCEEGAQDLWGVAERGEKMIP
jgi:hypothetical protein